MCSLTIIDGDIHLHTGFNGDAGQLLDDIRRSVQINDTLVDAHLEPVPRVGTFSRRSLTGGNGQLFGGHAHGSTDVQLLVEGDLFQIGTDLFNVGDIATRQCNTDAVDRGRGGSAGGVLVLLGWVGRHDEIEF